MNNIKLPSQEWLGYDPERGDIHGYTFEQMKNFSTYIIKECLTQVMCEYGSGREIPIEGGGHYHSEDWDDALTRVYNNIKERFGVDE